MNIILSLVWLAGFILAYLGMKEDNDQMGVIGILIMTASLLIQLYRLIS